MGGQAWGDRRVRRGRCELGKLRVGAALPAPPAGLAGAPGPPCATPGPPCATRGTQHTQESSGHPTSLPAQRWGRGAVPFPAVVQGNGKTGANPWILGLPQPRCAFRAPSPSQGWGAKIKKDVQGMNIYLWVASDRCWGEDSWILQFAGGNNWNRLMRNILPNSCLPSATAPARSGLWDPNTQSSARLGVQEAAGAQLWWFPHRMEPETRKGMWPLGAGS